MQKIKGMEVCYKKMETRSIVRKQKMDGYNEKGGSESVGEKLEKRKQKRRRAIRNRTTRKETRRGR